MLQNTEFDLLHVDDTHTITHVISIKAMLITSEPAETVIHTQISVSDPYLIAICLKDYMKYW